MNSFKKILQLLFITSSVIINAQKKQTTKLGNSAVSDQPIIATTFLFDNPVYKLVADTNNNCVFFTTRKYDNTIKKYINIGMCGKIDADEDSLLWFKNVSQFDITNTNPYLILSNVNKSSAYNKEFGYDHINFPGKIVHINEAQNIVLIISNNTNKLSAHLLSTGNLVWQTTLNNEQQWVDLKYLNDTTLLIAASGLTSINLKTGKNWEIPLETHLKPTGPILISENDLQNKNSLNSVETATNNSNITFLSSNILINNKEVYFASKDYLTAIDSTGKIIWQQDLKKYQLSQTILSVINDEVLLFNIGKAKCGDKSVVYSKPFLLKFNKTTGVLNSDQTSKIETIFDFVNMNNSIVFANKKAISTTDITNALFESIIELDEKKYGQFKSFINPDEFYVEREGHIVPLSFINSQLIFFVTTNDKVYGVSNHKIEYEYHYTELYKKQFDINKAVLLKGGTKHFLVSKNFELLSTINSDQTPIYLNYKLFFSDKKKLHVVSLQNK
jgi:hypothetical protein